ncbi:hypothetical protein VTO73DRAFT_6152 [Trametes versicolor]
MVHPEVSARGTMRYGIDRAPSLVDGPQMASFFDARLTTPRGLPSAHLSRRGHWIPVRPQHAPLSTPCLKTGGLVRSLALRRAQKAEACRQYVYYRVYSLP